MVMRMKTKAGGTRPNAGRKTREQMGLEPVKIVTTRVEESVIKICKEKHGSLAAALRFAAKS